MKRNRTRLAQERKQKVLKQKISIGILSLVLLLCGSTMFGSFFTKAHGNASEDPVGYKYYKSIEIQDGDSLWSIAEDYMTDEYDSVYDYIHELKEINGLDSDNIQDSRHLMVAYSDTSFH